MPLWQVYHLFGLDDMRLFMQFLPDRLLENCLFILLAVDEKNATEPPDPLL